MPRAPFLTSTLIALALFCCSPGPTLDVVERTDKNEFGLITCSGASDTRTCYTHRAIVGVSMGSSGAGQLGFLHPELFDAIGMLGIPLVDWVYMLRQIRHTYTGGFCDLPTLQAAMAAPDNLNDPAGPANCAPVRGVERLLPKSSQIIEADQDFNHWYRWIDEGRGGGFGRNSLRESFQDITLAYGNALYYNPDSPYFPPGVPNDFHNRTDADRCANPVVIHGLKHKEYNPEGTYNVLAFCDTDTEGGNFDPSHPADRAAEMLLAVDLNGNNRRDFGEPVIEFFSERFQDVGSGPNDKYDWETNPKGHGSNWRWDEGEPFDDFGLDGIPNTHDYGEGNGRFDYNPNVLNYWAMNPRMLIEELPQPQLDRLNVYADAGIRDFLMSAVGTNWMWGALQGRVGALAKDYVDFPALNQNLRPYDFLAVDYRPESIGRHAYVRYGDPNASERLIKAGDGHHVGTTSQVLDRFLTSMSFIQSRWYPGARDVRALQSVGDPSNLILRKTYPSKVLGIDKKFGIVVPPGYDDPANAAERYPVMYFLHGQGMESDSLLASGILFFGYMAGSAKVEVQRRRESDWAKFILVFPDSKCDDAANECRTGNFNTNHKGYTGDGGHFEDALYELMGYVEANYRTAVPVEVPR